MPARTVKIRHDDETRSKIQAAQIINRFHKCVMGEITLDAQQVSCGKALLNKALPDLSSVSMDGELKHGLSDPLAELLERIAANGKRIHND
jgi:hypothetical protein